MTVYLLHFERKLADHAGHYIGYCDDGHLEQRIKQHRSGNGARIMEVCAERGIGFRVVRAWMGSRGLERRLKRQKNAWRLCPVCNPEACWHRANGGGTWQPYDPEPGTCPF